jgi:hypothetical protein
MNLKKLLNEIDFSSQSAFDAYKEKHKMRDTTKVNVAGKETTVGAASKKSATPKEEPKKAKSAKKVEQPKKETPKQTSTPKHTPVEDNSPVVKNISQFTTLRTKALADFINKHKLDADAISKFVEKGSLKDRIMVGTALVANPGNEYEKKMIAKFGDKGEEKRDGGFQTPKRQGNPKVNIAAKKKAEEYGITPQKLGNDGYKKTMLKAAVEALTDANFHDEARELVATIEKKPEWAKRVDYPKFEDPKYQEKMADIRKNGVDSSEYWNGDDNAHEYGRKVSQEAGWGGVEATDGIAFTLRMNGFHKEADMIQSIFDNKPYMK